MVDPNNATLADVTSSGCDSQVAVSSIAWHRFLAFGKQVRPLGSTVETAKSGGFRRVLVVEAEARTERSHDACDLGLPTREPRQACRHKGPRTWRMTKVAVSEVKLALAGRSWPRRPLKAYCPKRHEHSSAVGYRFDSRLTIARSRRMVNRYIRYIDPAGRPLGPPTGCLALCR